MEYGIWSSDALLAFLRPVECQTDVRKVIKLLHPDIAIMLIDIRFRMHYGGITLGRCRFRILNSSHIEFQTYDMPRTT